jgi:uncharacterized protein YndB with AHSA1/START domain
MEAQATPVTLVRTLKASAQEVYNAWTDPALFQRWMTPGPDAVTTAEFDPRVGGRYRIETRMAHQTHVTTGEYRELVPGRRLVQTWIYEGPHKEFEHHETLLTVELRELGPRLTELTLKHERTPDANYGNSVRQGWTACLDRLEAVAAAGQLTPVGAEG